MRRTNSWFREFPVKEFVGDTPVYRTLQGDLAVTYKVRGLDPGCVSTEELEPFSDDVRAALSSLDSKTRFQSTMFNDLCSVDWVEPSGSAAVRDAISRRLRLFEGKQLYRKQLFFTFIAEGSVIKSLAFALHVEKLAAEHAAAELEAAQKILTIGEWFRERIKDRLAMRLLECHTEIKRFLNRFVAFQPHEIEHVTSRESDLNYWIPNARTKNYGSYLVHDGHFLRAVSVRDLPRIPDGNPDPKKVKVGSYAGIFGKLLGVKCPFVATMSWRRQLDASVEKGLNTLHKNWDNRIVSAAAKFYQSKHETRRDMRQDTSAADMRDEIGAAKTSLRREPWGEFQFTVVLHSEDAQQVKAAVPAVYSAMTGARCITEDVGTYDAWTSMIPGNFRRSVRTVKCPISCAVDCGLWWNDGEGVKENRYLPDGKAFAIVETTNHGVHALALNEAEVFVNIIFGEQGSGKTTLGNLFLEHFQRLSVGGVRPKTLVLDMKDSYRENTLRHGGMYLQISLDRPGLRTNPWGLRHSRNSVETITRLIKVLLAGEDGAFQTTPAQDVLIVKEVEAKYIQKERRGLAYARLGAINLGADLQARLAPWVGSGQYAEFFDSETDDMSDVETDWLTIQFTGFQKHPAVLRALSFWHWDRFMSLVYNPELAAVPKLVLVDEAHEQMLHNPQIAQYMLTGINTGRSYYLWNIFVMQWAHLLAKHPFGSALSAACPVKFFCASSNINAKEYETFFEMSSHVAQTIKSLEPRKQVLRYAASGAQVLNVSLDQVSLDIYSNDVQSNAARYARSMTA